MMKNLHFRENFKNFLFDLEDFITIYENHLHVFNYKKLNKLSESEIVLSFNKMLVTINGVNLKIKQMTKQELLINGSILKVEFSYE
ncbi:MAG: YabP/YqfC family sporulation protein [Bacilli bacterium]|nr:YabP/YqfC family sporulation protein [Bacilli bacterium]MBQ8902481.1 YabP/YqfC family sporulation protein [Bacilli bacterium]